MIRTSFPTVKNGQPVRRSRNSSRRNPVTVKVAPRTGRLACLAGQHVLVIADCQNLDMGAANLDLSVDWKRLGQTLANVACSISRHAFICEPAGRTRQHDYFARSGWTPHSKLSRNVRSRNKVVGNKNTDHLMAFFAGVLVSRSQATLVLIASGDGDLVEDLSEAIGMLPSPRPVATLSIAGSTSHRLDARHSRFVIDNVELGRDCLRPS
jgi:hypothetical protein